MEQRPHNALAHRDLHSYRLIITLGGSIAAVYSRSPLLLDYDFASHTPNAKPVWPLNGAFSPVLLAANGAFPVGVPEIPYAHRSTGRAALHA